jgi:uncharacterized protein YdiU (UPF0061 family)
MVDLAQQLALAFERRQLRLLRHQVEDQFLERHPLPVRTGGDVDAARGTLVQQAFNGVPAGPQRGATMPATRTGHILGAGWAGGHARNVSLIPSLNHRHRFSGGVLWTHATNHAKGMFGLRAWGTMTASTTDPFVFDNSYAALPSRFYANVQPTPVKAPRLLKLNEPLAASLGLDPQQLSSDQGLAFLSGNVVPRGAASLALAYAGHQFGHFNPQLGDGRAILLGEILDRAGNRHDLQLKGAGRTPFSRSGDGRAAVGPVLREYLMGEAMAALGIPTTRALAAVATGEPVYREEMLPGAVLTRVAQSHIRIGTFEYFAARKDVDALRVLADHALARHFPHVPLGDGRYAALLEGVADRAAQLVARWMLVGFIHGVMNTDNMTISGETLDYGPCAFVDAYHPDTVFSSIDHQGRYALANQPVMAHWNLTRLARAMLPLLSDNADRALQAAQAAVDTFPARYDAAYLNGLRKKLGLLQQLPEDDALAANLLAIMASNQADFTLTFRNLATACAHRDFGPVRKLFARPAELDAWARQWLLRLEREDTTAAQQGTLMCAVNPAFIPRNHRVEAALNAATHSQDLAPFETLLAILMRPYEDQPEHAGHALPPQPHEVVHATFCGT